MINEGYKTELLVINTLGCNKVQTRIFIVQKIEKIRIITKDLRFITKFGVSVTKRIFSKNCVV